MLARRRSLDVARAELERAEARDDDAVVRSAWALTIAAMEAAEARADPAGTGGGSAMDELRRQTLDGDELPRALASPGAWTSEDDDEDGAER